MKYSSIFNQLDFYKNDIVAVLKIGFLLLVICGGIRIFPLLVDKWGNRNLTESTFGVVTKIEANKYIKETLEGGKISTKGYFVEFDYFPDNQIFNARKYIDKSTLNPSQKANIRKLEIGDTLTVKYDAQHPENAKLVIKKFTH